MPSCCYWLVSLVTTFPPISCSCCILLVVVVAAPAVAHLACLCHLPCGSLSDSSSSVGFFLLHCHCLDVSPAIMPCPFDCLLFVVCCCCCFPDKIIFALIVVQKMMVATKNTKEIIMWWRFFRKWRQSSAKPKPAASRET